MTIKELKKFYKVDSYDRGKTLTLRHLTEIGTHTPSKYLATLEKVNAGSYVIFGENKKDATSKLDIILSRIKTKINSYDFNSEFYDPGFREGYFEELVVHEYLNSIGFKHEDIFFGTEVYKKENSDKTNVVLSISNLTPSSDQTLEITSADEKVAIYVNNSDDSATQISVNRDVHEMIDAIQSLTKFKYLETLSAILPTIQSLVVKPIEMKKVTLEGFSRTEDNKIKEKLIRELEIALKELKS